MREQNQKCPDCAGQCKSSGGCPQPVVLIAGNAVLVLPNQSSAEYIGDLVRHLHLASEKESVISAAVGQAIAQAKEKKGESARFALRD